MEKPTPSGSALSGNQQTITLVVTESPLPKRAFSIRTAAIPM
jgi:hypothetical protein